MKFLRSFFVCLILIICSMQVNGADNFPILDKALYPTTYGTAGYGWVSNGNGTLPTWQSVTVNGTAATPSSIVTPTYGSTPITLTDVSSITWDTATGNVANITLTASGHTFAAPTNLNNGGSLKLRIVQGGSGSYTVSWNAAFKWMAGIAPTLSTTVGAVDVITCDVYVSVLNCAAMFDMK